MYANGAFVQANAAYGSQNTTGTYANAAFLKANSACTLAQSAFVEAVAARAFAENVVYPRANAAFLKANSAYDQANSAASYANSAFLKANSAYASQNVTGTYANNAYDQANSAASYANSAFLKANSAYGSQNTTGTYANAAYAQANSASLYANGAFIQANAAYNSQNVTGTYANNAYVRANNSLNANVGGTVTGNVTIVGDLVSNTLTTTGSGGNITGANAIFANYIFAKNIDLQLLANDAYAQANSASLYANGAFVQANASYGSQNVTGTYANNAYVRANNSLNANTGGLVTGNVTIQGNLTITGNVFALGNNFFVDAGTIVTSDTLLILGINNYTTDILDIGFSGHYNDGTNAHSGFIRDAGTKEWHIFKGYTQEISANNNININDPSFTIDTLNANLRSGQVLVRGVEIGYYANAAFLQANTAYASQNVTGTYANNAYAQANSASLYANGAFVQSNAAYNSQNTTGVYANAAYAQANSASLYANGAFIQANASYDSQNITGTYANNAYTHANAAFLKANSAYDSQNVTGTYANSAYASQNVTGTYANNAYAQANSAALYANGAFIHANAAFNTVNSLSAIANTTNTTIVAVSDQANAAFLKANAAYASQNVTGTYANNAYTTANAAFIQSNASFDFGNSTYIYANSGFLKTNSAYQHANSAYDSQNTTGIYANSAFNQTNLAFAHANSAFNAANNAIDGYVRPHANASYNTANAAFAKANAAVFTITANSYEIYTNTSTGNIRIGLANVNASIGTYGGATAIPVINVDGHGRVLSVSNTTISVPPGTYIFPNTNQLVANANFGNVLIGLANVNSNIGTFGSEFAVPTITTDGYGRITAISNTTISIPQGTYIVNSSLITSNSSTGNVVLGLAPSGVTAGTYGGNGQTPIVTVDVYGRVTLASNTAAAVNTLSTIIRNSYTATAAQTGFNTTSSFTPGYADVYINGLKLSPADYTANPVGSITVLSPTLLDGDVVDIQTATTFIVDANTKYEKVSFTATAGQTAFTTSYVPGSVNVYLNGLRLKETNDFVANNGSTVTLTVACELNDIVEIEKAGMMYTYLDNLYLATRYATTAVSNGQTTFTVTGGYKIGFVDVYLNGIKLNIPSDVVASDGSTIVIQTSVVETGDIIEVVGLGPEFTPANAVSIRGGTIYGSLNVWNNVSVNNSITTNTLFVTSNVVANAVNVATVYFNDGTQMITAASGSGTGITWKIISANTTANTTEGFLVNTTSANVYITLNSSPSLGNTARIVDMAGNFAINNCIIKGNGNKVMGSTDDLVISSNNAGIGLVYSNATYGWRIIENP